jgi:hypothetical protein
MLKKVSRNFFGEVTDSSRFEASSSAYNLVLAHGPVMGAGLPDYSWFNIPKGENIFHMTTKYTKWPYNTSNDCM